MDSSPSHLIPGVVSGFRLTVTRWFNGSTSETLRVNIIVIRTVVSLICLLQCPIEQLPLPSVATEWQIHDKTGMDTRFSSYFCSYYAVLLAECLQCNENDRNQNNIYVTTMSLVETMFFAICKTLFEAERCHSSA